MKTDIQNIQCYEPMYFWAYSPRRLIGWWAEIDGQKNARKQAPAIVLRSESINAILWI